MHDDCQEPQLTFTRSADPPPPEPRLSGVERGGLAGLVAVMTAVGPWCAVYAAEHQLWTRPGADRVLLQGLAYLAGTGVSIGLGAGLARSVARRLGRPGLVVLLSALSGLAVGATAGGFAALFFGGPALPFFGGERMWLVLTGAVVLLAAGQAWAERRSARVALTAALRPSPLLLALAPVGLLAPWASQQQELWRWTQSVGSGLAAAAFGAALGLVAGAWLGLSARVAARFPPQRAPRVGTRLRPAAG